MLIHFFNHNRLSLVFHMVTIITAILITNTDGDHLTADIIRISAWIVVFTGIGLHVIHTVWLHQFVAELHNRGYPRNKIVSRVADVELRYKFSLLNFHMQLRTMDSFERNAVEGYFRTVRFKKWGLTPSGELNAQ